MRPWGPRGAGKATWVWVRGVLICVALVTFAELYTSKRLVWGFVEKSVNIRRFERCWPWIPGWWSRLVWWPGKTSDLVDFGVVL